MQGLWPKCFNPEISTGHLQQSSSGRLLAPTPSKASIMLRSGRHEWRSPDNRTKPATFTGSGLFHFWMRDIVLASIHFRDRRKSVTEFSQKVFDEICGYLATGESLRTVCKREGMPDKSNVFRWINANPELRDQYARAKADGCNALAEEMFDIADELPPLKDDGAIDQGHNTWAKNRVDVRKWYLSKIAPKIYGDRVDHTSSDGSMSPKPTTIELVAPDVDGQA